MLGCRILVHAPPEAPQPVYMNVSAVNSTAALVSLAYELPSMVSVVVSAVDGAGNLGLNTTLEWKVDAQVCTYIVNVQTCKWPASGGLRSCPASEGGDAPLPEAPFVGGAPLRRQPCSPPPIAPSVCARCKHIVAV